MDKQRDGYTPSASQITIVGLWMTYPSKMLVFHGKQLDFHMHLNCDFSHLLYKSLSLDGDGKGSILSWVNLKFCKSQILPW